MSDTVCALDVRLPHSLSGKFPPRSAAAHPPDTAVAASEVMWEMCVWRLSGGELLHVLSACSVWVTMRLPISLHCSRSSQPGHVSFLGHGNLAPGGEDTEKESAGVRKVCVCLFGWVINK